MTPSIWARFGCALAVVVTVGVPAQASDYVTAGANTGLVGTVAARVQESAYCLPDPVPTGLCQQCSQPDPPEICTVIQPLENFTVSADCTFAGVLTPTNTLIVEYAGAAVTTGPVSQILPLLTAIECEINNVSEGGSNSQTQDFSMNGSASAVVGSTLLTTSGPQEWPVSDITVCVSAFAIWGPTPVRIVSLARTCQTPQAASE